MTFSEIIKRNRVERPYSVTYVFKEDGRPGQSYRCETLEEAEETKARMEEVWGAELLDVVITKD